MKIIKISLDGRNIIVYNKSINKREMVE